MQASHKVSICYYITGHGLGHASRAVQVINSLPKSWFVYVKSDCDLRFLQREIKRKNIQIINESWDAGLVQVSNRAIDYEKSLSAAISKEEENNVRTMEEIDFFQKFNINLIISDISPTPLLIAKQAGIPSVVIANFTWIEIFQKFDSLVPNQHLIDYWLKCYSSASLSIKLIPTFEMPYLNNPIKINPLGRVGKSVREKLVQYTRATSTVKIVLLYFGSYDNTEIQIPDIDNTVFISFNIRHPKVIYIDPNKWNFADVLSSCDAVLAKPGYGIVSESARNGIPIIIHPRKEFAESEILKDFVLSNKTGLQIPEEDFVRGNWEEYLIQAVKYFRSPIQSDSQSQIAQAIIKLLN